MTEKGAHTYKILTPASVRRPMVSTALPVHQSLEQEVGEYEDNVVSALV